jgi:uncharacterized protein YjiS (DUF1127 family)
MENRAPAASRLLAYPSALWRGYRHHRERRAAIESMRRLGDHMLRDMGLDRGDIEDAVRGRRL